MKISSWFKKCWRWLEGLHTTVWLYTLVPAAFVAWLGSVSEIDWFWIVIGVLNAAAVGLYISQYFLRDVGWTSLSDAAAVAFGRLDDTYVGVLAARDHDSPEKRLDYMRRVVRSPQGQFLEPPYLVRLPDADIVGVSNWQQFFERNVNLLQVASRLEIGEFNLKDEWIAYQAYMQRIFRACTKSRTAGSN